MPRYPPRRRYSSYAKRRTPTKRARAPPRRRSYGRKRYGGKKMTTKRILDMTSTKKRDTMLGWTNSTSSNQSGSTTYTSNAAVINGGLTDTQAACFVWCATARDNTQSTAGTTGNTFTQATRTSSTPYMVGLKESIEVQCNTGMPWQWRRICFTYKGTLLTNSTSFATAIETSNGWVRVLNQLGGDPGHDPQYSFFVKLFKGQNTQDWVDPMIAKTDSSRVTVKYDKTITLASGNEDGFIRKYNRYHAMNKTLVYDDDELGGGVNVTNYSTDGKAGMGDYYVVDLIRARQGSATTDQITFRPEATLYWHEK
ncbi:capsid protein [Blackfly genomovirus 5]|uniref:Capsid protein n=1 Tax=Blackfly genomovirus 5 TaxID=2586204 RepID=A0A4Y5QKW8_9VIRU|nr:capsid protein [Blackfly genomovirus 5]QCX35066.1 capsid protein [Blackfly genomovirus 5]